jgi:hypothetical protein
MVLAETVGTTGELKQEVFREPCDQMMKYKIIPGKSFR